MDAVSDVTRQDHDSMLKGFKAASKFRSVRDLFTGDRLIYTHIMGVVALTGRNFEKGFARYVRLQALDTGLSLTDVGL